MFPWRQDSDSLVFLTFFYLLSKKCIFVGFIFFWNHFNLVFLLVLIIFESIWTVFWRVGHEIKKLKKVNSKWQLGRINHVIATSFELIVPCFWALKETVLAYNLPFRFHCHCINALELTKGADTKCPLGLGTWKKKIVLKRFCKINSRTLLSLFVVWTFTVRQFSVTYSAVQVTDNNRMCSLFDVKACRVSFFYCKE